METKPMATPESIIRGHIPDEALLELLAEECTELAHATLKLARILRGECPTPENVYDTYGKVVEEYSDVVSVARTLNIYPSEVIISEKNLRCIERLREKERQKKE